MLDDREAIDSRAYRRWQTLLAFTRGSQHSLEALARRRNGPLYAGLAVALLVCLVVGVKTLVSHGPPKDWDAEGTLVVDRDAGGRYLVAGGTLRPVVNLTSLRLLSGGAPPRSVQVAHDVLARRPIGQPIGIVGAPDQPPALLSPPTRWVACEGGRDEIDLLVGLPRGVGRAGPDAPGGILASAAEDPGAAASPGTSGAPADASQTVYLVTGTGAFAISSPEVLARLGYTPDQVRTVPRLWLDLLPGTTPLELQPLPGGAGSGTPSAPFMADGTLVVDRSSGVQYLASGGELHRVLNRTSLLLLESRADRPVQVSGDAVAAQPQGEPFGLAAAPASPPAVPEGTSSLFACISSDGEPAQVLRRPPVAGGLVRAAPPAGIPSHSLGRAEGGVPAVQVWLTPGHGLLARSSSAGGAEISSRAPVYLVTEGVAYPVPSEAALGALGYQREQVQPVPRPWLLALPKGPSLKPLKVAGH